MKWLPKEMGSLFIDNIDHNGLLYWHDTVLELIKRMKPKTE